MDGEALELYDKVEDLVERMENKIRDDLREIRQTVIEANRKLTTVCVKQGEHDGKIAWLTWSTRLLLLTIIGEGVGLAYVGLS